MGYCTSAQVIAYHPKVSGSGLTAEEFDTQITHWSGFIDARIGYRYSVPIANTPPILTLCNVLLVLASILSRTAAVAEYVGEFRRQADEMLAAIADGTMALVDSTGAVVSARAGLASAIAVGGVDYVPTFGAVPSLNDRVDPQRAEDEASERMP